MWEYLNNIYHLLVRNGKIPSVSSADIEAAHEGSATLAETHNQNRYRIQPNNTKKHETLHGGELVKWMDELSAMSAMCFADEIERTTELAFTSVAIDEEANPVQVPDLTIEADEKRRLREEARDAES